MILAPFFRQQFFDSNGNPLSGGNLYTYQAGTTTAQATYTDETGNTPNTNPIVLDANGAAAIWLDPSLAYKFILKDSLGNTISTVDNVAASGLLGAPGWNANSNYSEGAIVSDTSGVGIFYVSMQNNNLGNALSNVSFWRALGGNIRTVTAATTLLSTDEIVRSDSSLGALTHTLPACSTTPTGKRLVVKDVGSGGYTTSVKGSGTDNVDGSNTYVRPLNQYDTVTVVNNGSGWDII